MEVIPSLNCKDAACAREKIEVLKTFLPSGAYVHLDVTDGVFSQHATWNDPRGWAALAAPFALEVHLMVEHPLDYADDWFAAGARRLVVHAETLSGNVLHGLRALADRHKEGLVLTSKPETTNDEIEPFVSQFSKFQVLSVSPGAAGQAFQPFALEKIRFLREMSPNATIEVDGGVNPDTARRAKAAGADTLVSAHYLFDNNDPKSAFEELMKI
jgi:ribulose-phosphate 3-epimerase